MALQTLDMKPLPAPPSPTLTNPDMVLPNTYVLDVTEPQQTARPPSPSYLQAPTRKLLLKKKSRNLRSSQSPAQAFGSSPTLNVDSQLWDDRRISFAASSILSEDLENMQIPRFATSLDSDTETLDEDDFDIDTPSDVSYGDATKAEQSSVTLMRAELILANAKKRLNLMDQNLRGAREIVTPLTAANLKRATSLTTGPTSFSRPRYSIRDQQGTANQHMRVLSDSEVNPDERRYMSLNVNSAPSWTPNPVRATRSSEALRMQRAAFSPEPQLGTLAEEQSVRSRTSAHDLREQMMQLRGRISTLKERAQEENMRRRSTMNLRETCPLNDAQTSPGAEQRPRLERITRANNVPGAWVSAETIDEGKGEAEPELEQEAGIDDDDEDDEYTPPSGSDSPDRTSTPTTATTTNGRSSIYEDAPELSAPRHEDRADAFDYSKFFLHSATGSFTPTRRPRASSVSSSCSDQTARGPPNPEYTPQKFPSSDNEIQPPPTPETPEALRHIEAQKLPARPTQHRRGLSAESLASIASFETADEGHNKSIAQWLSRSTSAASIRSLNQRDMRPPSRAHPSTQVGLPESRPSSSPSRQKNNHHHLSIHQIQIPPPQQQTYISIQPSPSTMAVSALLDSQSQRLGSKDEALVYTLVESLRDVIGELQCGGGEGGGEERRRMLRRRLDEARRVLEG